MANLPDPAPAPETPMSPPHRRVRPLAAGIFVVLALIAATVAALALLGVTRNPLRPQVALTQRYTDPSGHFTIQLPPDWKVNAELMGTGREGDATASATTTMTSYLFYPASAGALGPSHGTSMGVGIVYTTYVGSFERIALCSIYERASDRSGAWPADPLPDGGSIFANSTGTYQIHYSVPGSEYVPPTGPRPTPLPAATITAARELGQSIIATFKPLPATAPSC